MATNSSNMSTLSRPRRPPFPPEHVLAIDITFYSVGFVFAAIGNVTMFLILVRNLRQSNRSHRVYLLLLHLNIADLIVTFGHMPHKIVTSSMANYWPAPSWLCRVMRYVDVFGLYLASNVLICMSVDRLAAISRPLHYRTRAHNVVRVMLFFAWFTASVFSVPQLFTFEKMQYPWEPYQWYAVCGTKTKHMEVVLGSTVLSALACYLLPASFIIVCYSIILFKIIHSGDGMAKPKFSRSSRSTKLSTASGESTARTNRSDSNDTPAHFVPTKHPLSAGNTPQLARLEPPCNSPSKEQLQQQPQKLEMRSTGQRSITKAKHRSLRMTIVVVSTFLVCWSPYFLTIALDLYDRDFENNLRHRCAIPWFLSSCSKSGPIVTKVLFSFAIFNTVFNPYLYGCFSFKIKHELKTLLLWLCSERVMRFLDRKTFGFFYNSVPNAQTQLTRLSIDDRDNSIPQALDLQRHSSSPRCGGYRNSAKQVRPVKQNYGGEALTVNRECSVSRSCHSLNQI